MWLSRASTALDETLSTIVQVGGQVKSTTDGNNDMISRPVPPEPKQAGHRSRLEFQAPNKVRPSAAFTCIAAAAAAEERVSTQSEGHRCARAPWRPAATRAAIVKAGTCARYRKPTAVQQRGCTKLRRQRYLLIMRRSSPARSSWRGSGRGLAAHPPHDC